MNWTEWERIFETRIAESSSCEEPAHDLLHFKRVVATAKKIASKEEGILDVILPAAWLHDFVIIPKDSPFRSQASKISAQKAVEWLKSVKYPSEFYEGIAHAIEAHSFSAGIEAKTLEAKIVQDADRLDGLGAIGIARCFATAGLLKRPFYELVDPFCDLRKPNDSLYTLDHFYQKLFKTAETLQTTAGRKEGKLRVHCMKTYLDSLRAEITTTTV